MSVIRVLEIRVKTAGLAQISMGITSALVLTDSWAKIAKRILMIVKITSARPDQSAKIRDPANMNVFASLVELVSVFFYFNFYGKSEPKNF